MHIVIPLLNLATAAMMWVGVYFIWKTPGTPEVRRGLRRLGAAMGAAAVFQIALAALRTWGGAP